MSHTACALCRYSTMGARHESGVSSPPGLPIILQPTAEPTAAKGNDGIGTANGPEHAGLFEAAADDGFAARFDHAGTHKQMLATELGIAHALGVSFEVIGCLMQSFGQFRRGNFQGTEIANQLLNLTLVQFGLVTQDPLSLTGI